MPLRPSTRSLFAAAATLLLAAPAVQAQWTPLKPGSDNIDILGHIPLGPRLSVADIDMEQEMDRPYAYVARMVYGDIGPKGLDIVSIADPEHPEVLYEWRIENQDLHMRTGGMDVKHFKLGDRYYVVQSLQFGQGGPNPDLGAVVLDVTGLPDASTVREVARIREPDLPGGFHNIFVYKHSDGRVLLFSTVRGPFAHVYDMARVVSGDLENALVGRVPVPENELTRAGRGYHDFYVGYHPDTGEDRFYAAAPAATTSTMSATSKTPSCGSPSWASAASAAATPSLRVPTAATSSPRPSTSTPRSASSTCSPH